MVHGLPPKIPPHRSIQPLKQWHKWYTQSWFTHNSMWSYMCHQKGLEYWQSQEGPRRALCKFAGAMLKLYKRRSKFTVKVTCLKSMEPLERYGHKTQMPNMNAQYLTVRKWRLMFKIVAAFRGMHVSPAKHSFGKCDRRVWQTDRQRDGQTTDKVIPMCRYASQATLCFAGDTKSRSKIMVKVTKLFVTIGKALS